MKTENRNAEQYVAPELTQIDILPEGVLCQSGGEGSTTYPGDVIPGI